MDLTRQAERLQTRLEILKRREQAVTRDLRRVSNPDSQERALERENDEVQERLDASTRDEMHAIRAALSRIEEGTYRRCIACGGEIETKRLEAMPWAASCLTCAGVA